MKAWGGPLDLQLVRVAANRYKATGLTGNQSTPLDAYDFTVSRYGRRRYLPAVRFQRSGK